MNQAFCVDIIRLGRKISGELMLVFLNVGNPPCTEKDGGCKFYHTVPCKPNTADTCRHIESHIFCEICPCTNNIVFARFEVSRIFLCIFMSIVKIFVC